MIASCMAKLAPMQTRGPAPNGRYWKRSIFSRFPGWKRSGMKASGLSHSFLWRWTTHGITSTAARLGMYEILPGLGLDRLAVDRRRRRIEPQRLVESGAGERHGIEPFRRIGFARQHRIDLALDLFALPRRFGEADTASSRAPVPWSRGRRR